MRGHTRGYKKYSFYSKEPNWEKIKKERNWRLQYECAKCKNQFTWFFNHPEDYVQCPYCKSGLVFCISRH